MNINLSLFYFLHSFAFQYPWLDSLIWFLAVPLIYITIVFVGIFLSIQYKIFSGDMTIKSLWGRGKEVFWIFFSAALAYFIAHILKNIIHTDRPFVALQNIQSLFTETDYAFPSGHSTTIAALAFAVYFRNKYLGLLCIGIALLIGLARVMAGVHFPIDIIGGFAIGFLVAFFTKSL